MWMFYVLDSVMDYLIFTSKRGPSVSPRALPNTQQPPLLYPSSPKDRIIEWFGIEATYRFAHRINYVNTRTGMVLVGLLSNSAHTLVVIMPWIDVLILIIHQIGIPNHIFKVNSIQFGTKLFLRGLLNRNSVFIDIQKFGIGIVSSFYVFPPWLLLA